MRWFGSWWLATIWSTRVLIRDSSNGGFILFTATTTALGIAQIRFIRGALTRVVKWSGSEATHLFATLKQQNAQHCFLDIYFIIPHWIFLRVSTHNLRNTGTYSFGYRNCRSTFHILHLYILNEMFIIVYILIVLMFLTLISNIQNPVHLCNYSTNNCVHFKYLTLLHHVTCVGFKLNYFDSLIMIRCGSKHSVWLYVLCTVHCEIIL